VLILSRKAGEGVIIDGNLRITVLATDGRTIRLGIDAPPSVRILRSEIVEMIERETVSARASDPALLKLAPIRRAP
jgi:carbon storage regulator